MNFFQRHHIQDPKFISVLFNDPRFSVLWLVLRVWLGWQWLTSGWGKLQNPAWTDTGTALLGYWERAVEIPEGGRPAITFGWYRDFLQGMIDANAHTWFSQLIVWGEILVGVALILGAFTAIAAFGGAVMNFNFMLAGSASTNPVLFLAALILIFAWKTAGYIGLDHWLLPLIGTPWGRGAYKAPEAAPRQASRQAAGD
jgi:thiosulfate dehydrogenase [quinone] large subunit